MRSNGPKPSNRSGEAPSWSAPPPSLSSAQIFEEKSLRGCQTVRFDGEHRPCLGRVVLLGYIGRGGMGAVYYGINPRLELKVAVKVLDLGSQPDQDREEFVNRFVREARLAARLRSEHLVQVFDVDQDPSGLHYIVMEYVQGVDAQRWGQRKPPSSSNSVSADEALQIGLAATTGLREAHRETIIHRDIKPGNLLIPVVEGENGDEIARLDRTKLADLGLARLQSSSQSLTATSSYLGTPGFMAPEQVRDFRNAGKAADVFSVGATLYSLLAGRPPFARDSPMSTLLATVENRYPPLETIRPDLPPSLVAILHRSLSAEPERRFPDASTLYDSLLQCRKDLRGGAPAELQPRKTEDPKKRRGSFRIVATCLVGIAIVGGIIGGLRLEPDHDPPEPLKTEAAEQTPEKPLGGPVSDAAPTLAPRTNSASSNDASSTSSPSPPSNSIPDLGEAKRDQDTPEAEHSDEENVIPWPKVQWRSPSGMRALAIRESFSIRAKLEAWNPLLFQARLAITPEDQGPGESTIFTPIDPTSAGNVETSLAIESLEDGRYSIRIEILRDGSGEREASDQRRVVIDRQAPSIRLLTPRLQDDDILCTNRDSTTLVVEVEDPNLEKVLWNQTPFEPAGTMHHFRAEIGLAEKSLPVTVKAVDLCGNLSEIDLHLIRDETPPNLDLREVRFLEGTGEFLIRGDVVDEFPSELRLEDRSFPLAPRGEFEISVAWTGSPLPLDLFGLDRAGNRSPSKPFLLERTAPKIDFVWDRTAPNRRGESKIRVGYPVRLSLAGRLDEEPRSVVLQEIDAKGRGISAAETLTATEAGDSSWRFECDPVEVPVNRVRNFRIRAEDLCGNRSSRSVRIPGPLRVGTVGPPQSRQTYSCLPLRIQPDLQNHPRLQEGASLVLVTGSETVHSLRVVSYRGTNRRPVRFARNDGETTQADISQLDPDGARLYLLIEPEVLD